MDTTIYASNGTVARVESWVYTGSGFTLLSWENYTYDSAGRVLTRVASNGATISNTYTGGRLTSTVGVDGTETQFTYDVLGRVTTSIKKGVAASGSYSAQGDITTTYTYDGAGRTTQTVASGGSLSLTSSAAYDLAGRQTSSTSPGSYTSGFSYSSGGKVVTATLPSGATKISESYIDGKLKSVTGTSVVSEYFTYNINSYGRRELVHRQVSTSGPIVEYVYSDWLERKILRQVPSPSGSGYIDQGWNYNSAGQLWKSTRTGVSDTLYEYDTFGRKTREGLDVNANGTLDNASDDRITGQSVGIFTWDSGATWWRQESNYTYASSGSGAATYTSYNYDKLKGYGTNVLNEHHAYDINGNRTVSITTVDRANKKVTATVDVPDSTTDAVTVAYNGLLMSSKDVAGITTTFCYDALGRRTSSIDPRTGATSTAYTSGTSQVYTITDPASVVQSTYAYDSAGRVSSVKDALNKYTYFSYTSRNEIYRQWGDTSNPVEYGYDSQGRQTTMKTYRGGSGWTGSTWPASPGTADTTTWAFHEPTGSLSSKTDASSHVVSYTYTQAGQIARRTWARGVYTDYTYSATTGELTFVNYSDSTPDITYSYNRLGKNSSIVDVTGTRTFNYNLGGTLELQSEDLPGYLGNRRITYGYDSATGVVGRPNALQLGTLGSPAADQSISYGYAADGRFNALSAGGQTFSFGYTSNSHLIATVTNSGANYSDSRTYDPYHDWTDNRSTSIGATSKAAFAYSQDNMGRITDVANTGEVFSRYGNGSEGLKTYYGYDDRSQLTSEVTKVGTSSTVLTGRNDSSYGYDPIGNRTSVTHNGNTANYTSNAVNQYTQRTVPGIFDVAGAAGSGTTVTVNGSSAGVTRHGEYFFNGYAMYNTPNPYYTTLSIADGTSTAYLAAYTAGTPEVITYDDDGNMTSDGRFNYTFDAENRISYIATTTAATSAGHPSIAVSMFYDYLGRRVRKVDSTPGGTTDRRYIYNGWNLMAEYYGPYGGVFPTGGVRNSYWGMDLSGSMQGAGGVGGLLMVQEGGNTYLPMYNANGNVMGLIKASDGSVAAAYEYDAFGNTVRESGNYAAINPFRFSTKYADVETALIYYGLRYYSPSLGRFINKDPIEEQGGNNLYRFCSNNAINKWDNYGLLEVPAWFNGNEDDYQAYLYSQSAINPYDTDGSYNSFFDAGPAMHSLDAWRQQEQWARDMSAELTQRNIDAHLRSEAAKLQEVQNILDSGRPVTVVDGNGLLITFLPSNPGGGMPLSGAGGGPPPFMLHGVNKDGSLSGLVFGMGNVTPGRAIELKAAYENAMEVGMKNSPFLKHSVDSLVKEHGLLAINPVEGWDRGTVDNWNVYIGVTDVKNVRKDGSEVYGAYHLFHEVGHAYQRIAPRTLWSYPIDVASWGGPEQRMAPNSAEYFALNFANRVSSEVKANAGIDVGYQRTYYDLRGSTGIPAPLLPPKS